MCKKTIVITGANGYFGSIACQYFEEEGRTVLRAGRQNNCDILLNLNEPEKIANLRIAKKVDLVIHAAAANEVICNKAPYNSVFNNIVGTKAVLDFCVNNNIENMVYLSTFHVYGNPSGVIDENVIPMPMNDYGLSHLQAEEYVQMYNRNGKLKGMVLRPSNLFGIPADIENCNRWSLVTLGFIREAIRNGKIELKTSGIQERNFVSATDVCKFIEKAFLQIKEYPLVNIVGNETISIKNLALLIQEIAQKHCNINIEVLWRDEPAANLQAVKQFEYISCYANKIWEPLENISQYIISMFNILLTDEDRLRLASDKEKHICQD